MVKPKEPRTSSSEDYDDKFVYRRNSSLSERYEDPYRSHTPCTNPPVQADTNLAVLGSYVHQPCKGMCRGENSVQVVIRIDGNDKHLTCMVCRGMNVAHGDIASINPSFPQYWSKWVMPVDKDITNLVRNPSTSSGTREALQRMFNPCSEVLADGTPMCPKCNTKMVLKTSRFGQQFWGCSRYPRCTGSRNAPQPGSSPTASVKFLEIQLQKLLATQQDNESKLTEMRAKIEAMSALTPEESKDVAYRKMLNRVANLLTLAVGGLMISVTTLVAILNVKPTGMAYFWFVGSIPFSLMSMLVVRGIFMYLIEKRMRGELKIHPDIVTTLLKPISYAVVAAVLIKSGVAGMLVTAVKGWLFK